MLTKPEMDRYQHLQQLVQHFWNRWRTEYLHQLQKRNKWNNPSINRFKPNTLVIVHDDHSLPLKWSLARILETHPGKDGITRVVILRGPNNRTFKRPIIKLCILPLEEESVTRERISV